MNNSEKKYYQSLIENVAYQLETGMMDKDTAATKLWSIVNEMRNDMKEDAER